MRIEKYFTVVDGTYIVLGLYQSTTLAKEEMIQETVEVDIW